MRAALIVCAVAGCNSIYDLDKTTIEGTFEAHCTPGEVPHYAKRLHQVLIQACTEYTISPTTQTAIAVCFDGFELALAEGPIDKPLLKIQIPLPNPPYAYQQPRLPPEGDRLLIEQQNTSLVNAGPIADSIYTVFKRSGGAWVRDYDIPGIVGSQQIGRPSASPRAHWFVSSFSTVVEYIETTPRTWTAGTPFPAKDLGVDTVQGGINLTSDGLRAVFTGAIGMTRSVYYVERNSIDEKFGRATPLENVPEVDDPFLTDDCGRVYFSGLGTSIFFAEQTSSPAS